MLKSFLRGVSFGLTSGVITTVGLLMGLAASTDSKFAVLAGICVIAIADALSDSLGMFVEEESQNSSATHRWNSTIATFLAKFFVAISFALFVILFPLYTAVNLSVFWGLFLTGVFSLYLAKIQKKAVVRFVTFHIVVTITVILVSFGAGKLIAWIFG